MKISVHISKWSDPNVVRRLWSRDEYVSVGGGPVPLITIFVKRRKDRLATEWVSFDKIDVYWHLGWLAFFLACGVAGLLLARMT